MKNKMIMSSVTVAALLVSQTREYATMTTTKSPSGGVIGANFNQVDVAVVTDVSRLSWRAGQRLRDNAGGEWVYAKVALNSTAGVQGNAYHINGAGVAVLATTTLALFGFMLGFPAVAIPADTVNDQYAWFQVHGPCEGIRVAASCVQRVRLNTTATAGLLDDDATSGAKTADGVTIDTTDASAATSTVAGILTNARVLTTL